MTKKTIDIEAGTITVETDSGETVVFTMNEVSDEIKNKLAFHGASQKIGDSYAGAKKACEGTEIDPGAYAIGQAGGVIAQLLAGDWNVRSGGAGGPATTDLSTALAEATGCSLEEAAEKIANADADQKKGLRAHPAIKAVLDQLRAHRAAIKATKSAGAADEAGDPLDLLG